MITLRTRFRKAIPDPPAARRQVVVALGGHPLLERGEIDALAGLAREHDVVVIASSDGMNGYVLERELRNRLPGRAVVTVLTQVVVDGESPASGEPREIVELPAIKLLLGAGALVVCTGGGGIPVVLAADGSLQGVEAVIDKDLVGELLARTLGADDLLLLTDVPAVQLDWGTPEARTIHRATPQELRGHAFAADSMGPKVEAACRFVERTGGTAAIGALRDAAQILAGNAGTIVRRDLY